MTKRDVRMFLIYPWGNPLEMSKGVSVRTSGLLELMKKLGIPVKIISLGKVTDLKVFQDFIIFPGRHGMILDLNPSYYVHILRQMKMNVKAGHNVVVVLTGPIGILGVLFNKILFKTQFTIIYDAHNIEKERVNSDALSTSNWFLKTVTKLILILSESLAVRYSDCILAISYRDKRKFMEIYSVPLEKIKVVYPSLFQAPQKTKACKPAVLFHGSFKYLPNREAIETIFKVSEKLPWVRFFIAGSGVPRKKQKNIEFLGFIKDLDEFFNKGDLAVIPLKRGAGVKMKIVDYLSKGIPVVTTPVGAQGLEFTHWKHAIIVDIPEESLAEEFRQVIEFLMLNPKFKRKIGYLGYKHARMLFDETKAEFNLKNCIFRKFRL